MNNPEYIMRLSNIFIRLNLLLLLFSTMNTPFLIAQTKIHRWNNVQAKKLVKENDYLKKLNIKPHRTVDIGKFSTQYNKNKELWNKVLCFMGDNDLSKIKTGRYEIDGDKCFALVSEYQTKEISDTKIEAHKRYIDLQYVVKGQERIGIPEPTSLSVKVSYNNERDVAIYTSQKIKYYPASQKYFFLFFPGDAHIPSVKQNNIETVKKIVVKIIFVQ